MMMERPAAGRQTRETGLFSGATLAHYATQTETVTDFEVSAECRLSNSNI